MSTVKKIEASFGMNELYKCLWPLEGVISNGSLANIVHNERTQGRLFGRVGHKRKAVEFLEVLEATYQTLPDSSDKNNIQMMIDDLKMGLGNDTNLPQEQSDRSKFADLLECNQRLLDYTGEYGPLWQGPNGIRFTVLGSLYAFGMSAIWNELSEAEKHTIFDSLEEVLDAHTEKERAAAETGFIEMLNLEVKDGQMKGVDVRPYLGKDSLAYYQQLQPA